MSTSQPPPGFTTPEQPVETAQPTQAAPQQMVGASGPRAGFWRRFAAAFLDGLIVGIPIGILEAALKGPGYALGVLLAAGYITYFEGGPTGAGANPSEVVNR